MGGGGPKIKTGIKMFDNTANNVASLSSLGTLGNSFSDIGKNVEANGQQFVKNAVGIFQPGGLNNFGSTFTQNEAILASLGTADAKDIKTFSGTSGIDRKINEASDKEAAASTAAALADSNARTEETLRAIRSTISGAVDAKKRTPGKRQTLLSAGGDSGASNNLLKIANG